PESSLSRNLDGLPDTAPRAGDRFPWLRLKFSAEGPVEDLYQKLSDLQFHLVLFGQPAAQEGFAGRNQLLQVHAIPRDASNDQELARVQIPQLSFYLIRPDGYVGLCGLNLSASDVEAYLVKNLGLLTGVPAAAVATA